MDFDPAFRALADKSRRELLDRLFENNGQTSGELCDGLDMSRQAVTKHLAILEEAKLVATLWRGREKLHYLNPAPIHDIAERWIGKYERGRLRVLSSSRKSWRQTMAESRFVYVTYIRTTPEKLWQALIEPEFTRQYWCETWQDCDWKQGSSWKLMIPDGRVGDAGEVLEIDPPRRLVALVAERVHAGAEGRRLLARDFELEPDGESVKLTVTHEMDKPDSKLIEASPAAGRTSSRASRACWRPASRSSKTRKWPEGM